MVVKKYNLGDLSDAEGGGFAPYDGPIPPKGTYNCMLRRLSIKGPNKNGDDMFNYVVEIAEPKDSPKAKFNGCSQWGQQNISEEGAGYVNAMLVAVGGDKGEEVKKAFWTKGARVGPKDNGQKEPVLAIGPLKVPEAGIPVVVSAAPGKHWSTGEQEWQVKSFLKRKASASVEEPDEDDEEYEEAETDEVEVEEVEGEDDEFKARETELEELDRTALKAIAKPLEIRILKSMTDNDIIDAILDAEFPEEEATAESEEEEDELEEEPEPEPEPEPAPRRRRAPAAAKKEPVKTGARRSRAKADDDEPPF